MSLTAKIIIGVQIILIAFLIFFAKAQRDEAVKQNARATELAKKAKEQKMKAEELAVMARNAQQEAENFAEEAQRQLEACQSSKK